MCATRCLSLPLASLALVFLLHSSPAHAEPWLHVKVLEHGRNGETVRVNVPVSLANSILPILGKGDGVHASRFRMDHCDLTPEQMRQMLAAVRDAKDGEYVTVDGVEEKVRIEKKDGTLFIKVDEEQPGGDHVQIRMRMEVLDALLSGSGDELNIGAALAALKTGEELVQVESEDETVRIWVDDDNVSD